MVLNSRYPTDLFWRGVAAMLTASDGLAAVTKMYTAIATSPTGDLAKLVGDFERTFAREGAAEATAFMTAAEKEAVLAGLEPDEDDGEEEEDEDEESDE